LRSALFIAPSIEICLSMNPKQGGLRQRCKHSTSCRN
jgi:hypothetical protein